MKKSAFVRYTPDKKSVIVHVVNHKTSHCAPSDWSQLLMLQQMQQIWIINLNNTSCVFLDFLFIFLAGRVHGVTQYLVIQCSSMYSPQHVQRSRSSDSAVYLYDTIVHRVRSFLTYIPRKGGWHYLMLIRYVCQYDIVICGRFWNFMLTTSVPFFSRWARL